MNLKQQARVLILKWLNEGYEIDTRACFAPIQIENDIGDELKKFGINGDNEIEVLCKDLAGTREAENVSNDDLFRITTLGRKNLETDYNEEYQERLRQYKTKQQKTITEKQEEKEKKITTRHKETLFWTKIGVLVSIAISLIALTVSILYNP